MKKQQQFWAYVMIAPMVLGILVFAVYPMVTALVGSLFSIDVPRNQFLFIGLENYKTIFSSPDFLKVVGNTLIYVVSIVGGSLVFGTLLAVWLSKKKPRYNIVLTIIFSPHVVSLVSVSILWMWLLDPDKGLVNYLLGLFGIEGPLWLTSPSTALISVIIVGFWKVIGYNTLILVSGLQMIPLDVYEAARLDGAGFFKTLTNITVPLLSPSLFFVFITSTISSFGTFDSVSVMTQGKPMNSSNVLAYWIYETGFKHFRLGEAMAGSVILILIIVFVSYFNFKSTAQKVHY